MKEPTKLNDKTRHPNTPRGGTPVRVQQTQPLTQLVQLAREQPERLTAVHLTQLQSVLGNRALNRLVSQHTPSLVLQPKLQVNAVGDKYEQEADAVAKEVVQKLNAPQTDATPTHAQRHTEGEESIAQRIQRQAVPEEEEMQLQWQEAKDEELQLQRQVLEEEEAHEIAMLQREAASQEEELQLQRQELPEEDLENMVMTQRQPQDFTHGGPVDSQIEAQINQSRGGGQPMEDSIRLPMEQAFGADFSDVRIHTDAQAHTLNEAIQARAFTTGHDIYFNKGEYDPANPNGQELIAHELTHTYQQSNHKINREDNEYKPLSFYDQTASRGLHSHQENKRIEIPESSSHFFVQDFGLDFPDRKIQQELYNHATHLAGLIKIYRTKHADIIKRRQMNRWIGAIVDFLGFNSIPELEVWDFPYSILGITISNIEQTSNDTTANALTQVENLIDDNIRELKRYDEGIDKGGKRAISALEIVKSAGKESAEFVATSTFGPVGGKAVGFAYSMFQSAAEKGSSVYYKTEQEFDWMGLLKDGALDILTFGLEKVRISLRPWFEKYLGFFINNMTAQELAEIGLTRDFFVSNSRKIIIEFLDNVTLEAQNEAVIQAIEHFSGKKDFSAGDVAQKAIEKGTGKTFFEWLKLTYGEK